MHLTNTRQTYGLIHQCLHWATAILIIAMLILGKFMHELPFSNSEEVINKAWWYSMHKTLGMITLVVVFLRVIWALIQVHPQPLKAGFEAFAAKVVHWVLYASMILLPLTGWLHHAAAEGFAPIWWPFPQTLPFVPKDADISLMFSIAHNLLGYVLVGSLFLHIAGALKHAIIDKDQVLARMLPGQLTETPNPPLDTGSKIKPFAAAFLVLALVTTIGFGIFQRETGNQSQASGGQTDLAKPAMSGTWKIDQAKSELAIEVLQMGTPVKGTFGKWRADVTFDPTDLTNAKIDALVDVASLKLGDVTDQALSADFLNASNWPQASFVSNDISKTDQGFEAKGTLSIAGMAQEITLPFSFEENDGQALVTARVEIDRLMFGIGKSYTDDETVNRKISLLIKIEATR